MQDPVVINLFGFIVSLDATLRKANCMQTFYGRSRWRAAQKYWSIMGPEI